MEKETEEPETVDESLSAPDEDGPEGEPDAGGEEEPEPAEPEEPREKRNLRREGLLLLRDLGVALLVVLIIIGIVAAYTQVWPPMVVIESGSMQHSPTESSIGVIDTGDLVLVQKADTRSSLVTYVQGRETGHRTYGDYGDVVIYREGGDTIQTPIIHRIMFYFEWNETAHGWDMPDLATGYWMDRLGIEWGGSNWRGGAEVDVASPYGLNGTLWLKNVGVNSATLTFQLKDYFDTDTGFSGYVTAGDNNVRTQGSSAWDRSLVHQDYIIGKARGELPWFGLLKLTLFDEGGRFMWFGLAGTPQIPWGAACPTVSARGCAPANSWSSLAVALVVMFVLPLGVDFGLSYWSKRKEKRVTESRDEEE